jgi:hypothetical protein
MKPSKSAATLKELTPWEAHLPPSIAIDHLAMANLVGLRVFQFIKRAKGNTGLMAEMKIWRS